MRKSYNNIKVKNSASRTTTENADIEATHLYVKFIPKTENELDIIKRDSTLVLYDYPLDYEIGEGDVYRDPDIPEGQPTPQYCAVNIDYQFSAEVEYEIIEELYIPDEDNDENKSSRNLRLSQSFVEQLVDESLRITGNLKENESESETSKLASRASKWRPAGRILVWDENIGETTTTEIVGWNEEVTYDYTPCYTGDYSNCPKRIVTRTPIYQTTTINGSFVAVEGVKVRARRWFTTHRGIANSNGYYSCDGTFRRPANYSIDWERYDFALQDGWLNGATYNGPKIRGNWNLNLRGNKQAYYATIFRAAHHYYYKDIRGLRRPPQNSFWRTQMKIRAKLENVSDEGSLGTHTAGWRAFGLYSPIKIYTYQRPAIETYATTIHELAHASHWNMDRSDFNDSETKVKESWARGVQWELTRMIYPTYRGGATIRPNYTQVVVDMIDYPSDNNNGSENLLQDNVQGYTIRQIEDGLIHQETWNNWKNNIKNKFNNETENNLETLFNHWD